MSKKQKKKNQPSLLKSAVFWGPVAAAIIYGIFKFIPDTPSVSIKGKNNRNIVVQDSGTYNEFSPELQDRLEKAHITQGK